MTHVKKQFGRMLCFWIWSVTIASASAADARTEYLINMLAKGANYRIRVQAATTLGKIRATEAVPALVRATRDKHELVVISSATALGQIGDHSVLPDLEESLNLATSSAAKSQLKATIRILKALSPQGTIDKGTTKPRFLIRIDTMGNSSASRRKEIVEILRDTVAEKLNQEPDVIMQKASMSATGVKAKVKKEHLTGYIISGSVIRLERVDDRVIVKLGLNVFSNPDYNLVMMPTAEGSVPLHSESVTREAEQAAQDRALKAVADDLISGILAQIRQMEP